MKCLRQRIAGQRGWHWLRPIVFGTSETSAQLKLQSVWSAIVRFLNGADFGWPPAKEWPDTQSPGFDREFPTPTSGLFHGRLFKNSIFAKPVK